MTAWTLTLGLQNLRAQVNTAFPNRDHTSDGTIGDTAHQAETSSHNPDDTPGSTPEWNGDSDNDAEVRAWDMDSDLRAAPATAQQVVDHIRHLPGVSSVLRYMIYDHKIYRASNGWAAETYTGASAHTEHIHFTGAFSQAADNNTSFNYRLEEIPVALTQGDKDWISNKIDSVLQTNVPVGDDQWQASTAIGYSARQGYLVNKNLPNVDEIAEAVAARLGVVTRPSAKA
jgi:hypothetical protein